MIRRALMWFFCLAALQACGPDRTGTVSSGEGSDSAPDPGAARPVAVTEYTTSLLFLPFEPATTRALILDFANVATSDAVDHRYLGWQLTGSGWRTILDIEARDAPLREPWRLFPVDSLRLMVTADGDADAVVLSTASGDNTLDLGEYFDRWEDGAGTRHEIREARWIQRGQRITGVAVQHRFAIPEPDQPSRFGPYDRAILRSADGAVVVLFSSRSPETYGSSYAWMYADGLSRRWTAVESRTVEVANAPELRRNVPVRIWFRIPEPDIRAEITVAERQLNEYPTAQGPKPYNALYRVRGWIEFAGERRDVEGLLERGET
jgi:hypothetical protein